MMAEITYFGLALAEKPYFSLALAERPYFGQRMADGLLVVVFLHYVI